MKKIMDIFKKYWYLFLILILILITIFIVVPLFKSNQKEKLELSLKELGTDFYENFYYDQIGTAEEKEAFLSRFITSGIKVNLDNLSRYNADENAEIIKTFVNNSTNKECDKENSKAIIYPKSPYGKKDYTIDVILDCGFKK